MNFNIDLSEAKGVYHCDFKSYIIQLQNRAIDVKSGWNIPIESPIGTVYHEFGHLFDHQIKFRKSDEFKSLISDYSKEKYSKDISRYATYYDDVNTRNGEIIAEAWAEYQLSENPRPKAIAIGKELERLFKKQNKRETILDTGVEQNNIFINPPDIFDEDKLKEKVKEGGQDWWKN